MRRQIAVAALALLAVGCGSSTGTQNSTSSAPAGEQRSVTDAAGKTVAVPTKPAKVVTLSEPTTDAAVALGVKPIGISSGRGQQGASAYLADKVSGIPIVASTEGPDLEKITALKPDLILVDGTTSAARSAEQLAKIAPTVNVAKTGAKWQDALAVEAKALGADGDKVLNDYKGKVDEAKQKIKANAGKKVSVVRWTPKGPALLLKETAAGTTLTDLGLGRPASQDKEGPGHSVPVSAERYDELNADWMFFASLSARGGASADASVKSSEQALSQAQQQKTFAVLPVVRGKHVVAVDGSSWASAGGPLAADSIVADVARSLGS